MMRRLRTLAADVRAVTAVEFAIVAPVLCLFLVGAFDMAHSLYMTATLQGVVQKTARDSSIESNTGTATADTIDDRVRAQVRAIANNASIVISRRFYKTFAKAQAAQAETWTDTNRNGRCDAGEGYQDANANTVWDADGGDAGQGKAKDRTVYTVTVSYPRLLPIWKFIGIGSTQTIVAKTVLQNQPYAEQVAYPTTVVTRYCS